MATKLYKPVRRELMAYTDMRGRRIIVTLLPGDMLGFRVKGSKNELLVHLGHCYRIAMIMSYEEEYIRKKQKYAQRRKMGHKSRSPKKPILPFNVVYFKAVRGPATVGK